MGKNLYNFQKVYTRVDYILNYQILKNTDEKLFSPRTASFNSFCYDDNYHVMKGTNSIIISLKLSTKYILALLNSSLASYFYHMYGFSYHVNTAKKYEPGNIKDYMIPIRIWMKINKNHLLN